VIKRLIGLEATGLAEREGLLGMKKRLIQLSLKERIHDQVTMWLRLLQQMTVLLCNL
jgi:hypothetical protein